MSPAAKRKLLVYVLLVSICGLAAIYLAWDLSRILDPAPVPTPLSSVTQALRLTVVVLCNLLVQLIGRDGQGGRLAIRLGAVFILILVADMLLTFGQVIPGVAMFALVQVVLTARHLAGWRAAWASGAVHRHAVYLIACAAGALAACGLLLGAVFWPRCPDLLWCIGLTVYALLLTASAWAALASPALGYFPLPNAVLIAVAMLLFALCDVTVGLSLVLTPADPLAWLTHTTWTLYTPALVLLVLSGYSLRYLAPWLPDEA